MAKDDEAPSFEPVLPDYEDPNLAYIQYIEAKGGAGISPLSAEGLELQAAYLAQMQERTHPFDVLQRISTNPFAQPRDRIAASKTLLEYMARKIPVGFEVSGPSGKPVQIDQAALRNLSGEELDQLSAILEKTSEPKKPATFADLLKDK